jgi:hypothetical protein
MKPSSYRKFQAMVKASETAGKSSPHPYRHRYRSELMQDDAVYENYRHMILNRAQKRQRYNA